jgi:hypothetical protein
MTAMLFRSRTRDFSIFDVLQELRDTMADGKAPWIAALFRIERKTGKLNADFEYEHLERWSITPANVTARARSLRRHELGHRRPSHA